MDQDNVIILCILICSDHFVVKFLQKHVVFQLAVPQFQQEFLRSTGHLRVEGEFHIEHIFPHCSRKRLFKYVEIFESLFFRERKKRFL